ncbi:MAG TPA: hypothetical protein VN685_07575 [Rhizomicrobium sp.]|nr:hypothetical protein [Rhizomicrobium sp.]
MTDEGSDRIFVDRAFRRLPAEVPLPGFQVALLKAYDAWNARRPEGRWAALRAGLRQFSNSIWPGAPLWAPVSAFAFALLVGAGLGVTLPSILANEQPAFSLEQPASFSLSSAGVVQEDM